VGGGLAWGRGARSDGDLEIKKAGFLFFFAVGLPGSNSKFLKV
jgi:hypothetical protein